MNAKQQAIDKNKTLIKTAFLVLDLDILNLVAEHVMAMPLEQQYSLFFETWYKSVLLTRNVKNIPISEMENF